MNEAEISKLIDNVKPKTNAGHDGLYTKLLIKLIKSAILKQLTLLVNQSLNLGMFPDILKIAKVILIF
jgi:hypothetical protein